MISALDANIMARAAQERERVVDVILEEFDKTIRLVSAEGRTSCFFTFALWSELVDQALCERVIGRLLGACFRVQVESENGNMSLRVNWDKEVSCEEGEV